MRVAHKRHSRKRRRLANARLRTGKTIVVHKSKSGRTGSARSHRLRENSVRI